MAIIMIAAVTGQPTTILKKKSTTSFCMELSWGIQPAIILITNLPMHRGDGLVQTKAGNEKHKIF